MGSLNHPSTFKIVGLFFLFLLFCLVAVHLQNLNFKIIDNIYQLEDLNIDTIIHKEKNLLVFFHTPNCQKCKEFEPSLQTIQQQMQEEQINVKIGKLNGLTEKQTIAKYEISAYPTLILYSGSEKYQFNGQLEVIAITNWIFKKLVNVVRTIESQEDLQTLQNRNDKLAVYFGNDKQEKLFQLFQQYAAQNDDIVFAKSFTDQSLQKTQSISSVPDIVLFTELKKDGVKFSDVKQGQQATLQLITDFINEEQYPHLIQFNDRSMPIIFQKETIKGTVFLLREKNEKGEEAEKSFEKIALEKKGQKPLFCQSIKEEDSSDEKLLNFLGADSNYPQIIAIKMDKQTNQFLKFKFVDEIKEDNIRKFVSDYVLDKLEPFLKSDEIPEKNDDPVKIIVGKSFKNEVINNNKDILVEFYAPWCGHCKSLLPIYESVAKKLSKNTNIVLAKVDSTVNEIKGAKVEGYPTILFYSSKDKLNPITYKAQRSEESIIKFLKQNTNHPWIEPNEDL